MNKFVNSSHIGAIMCLFDRTEDKTGTRTGNIYAAQKQDYWVRNIKTHHLSLLKGKHKTQLFSV